MTENYVFQGKLEISETLSNPHVHFYFNGGTEFDRFLIWDDNSDGSFNVRFLHETSSHVYSKVNGKLFIEWKLVVSDDNAYFFVKNGNEYKLTLVYTSLGGKSLVIGSEAVESVFSDLVIITKTHDSEEYSKAISEKAVSDGINEYGNESESKKITLN